MSLRFLITFDGDHWLIHSLTDTCWASAAYQSPMLNARDTTENKTDKACAVMSLYSRGGDTQSYINIYVYK